jgi:hypothetical protein
MDPEEIKRKEIERQEKKRRKQEDRLKKLEEKRKSLQDGKPINEGSTDSHVDGISNDDHMRDSSATCLWMSIMGRSSRTFFSVFLLSPFRSSVLKPDLK